MGVLGKAFAPATDLLTDRRIALGDLVTHRFGLESIGTAFDLLRSKLLAKPPDSNHSHGPLYVPSAASPPDISPGRTFCGFPVVQPAFSQILAGEVFSQSARFLLTIAIFPR